MLIMIYNNRNGIQFKTCGDAVCSCRYDDDNDRNDFNLNFRANIGAVNVLVGTITNPSPIVLGVTAINNPSAALQIGENQKQIHN